MADEDRVTLRDIMRIQRNIYLEIQKVNDKITALKIKLALISSGVATAASILTTLFMRNL